VREKNNWRLVVVVVGRRRLGGVWCGRDCGPAEKVTLL